MFSPLFVSQTAKMASYLTVGKHKACDPCEGWKGKLEGLKREGWTLFSLHGQDNQCGPECEGDGWELRVRDTRL